MRWVTICLLALGLLGCRPNRAPAPSQRLAVTNTYLESAARDLLGDAITVIRLAEPGMCPGHFDLRPSQMTDLQSCRLLLRFEFQKAIDGKLRNGPGAPQIVVVATAGGLGDPATYLAACRQCAEAFVQAGWLTRADADTRLAAIAGRLDALAGRLRAEVRQANLAGVPVLSSGHQQAFAQWLGLEVVATFRAADSARTREIDDAIAAGQNRVVKLIIANLPEGRRTADALAERLGARVAMFGNFPEPRAGRVLFDDLVSGNVAALVAAARP
jgi:zinc transport system substrate-binding protein